MKKTIFIFLIFVTANCFAQEKIEFTPTPKTNKRIVIIPFEEKTYFNDASNIFAEKDNISHEKILNYFRITINSELTKALSDSCYVINMLNVSDTRAEQEILDSLYSIASYEMDIAKPNNYQKENKKTKLFNKKKVGEENCETAKVKKTEIKNGEILETRSTVDDKYLKIVFSNKKIIKEIVNKRKADYIIFITEFEIIGNNYRDPYLSGNKDATRKLKIHFTIYDFSGRITHGGFAENNFPFRLNKKEEIIYKYLPEIIRQIISNINFKQ